jgi:hypothetical protein
MVKPGFTSSASMATRTTRVPDDPLVAGISPTVCRTRPAHVNIDTMRVTPRAQARATVVHRE